MNFLAHLFLSGNNEELMVGNFIADSVKGSRYNDYSGDIKNGIILHRFIDSYTDSHPIYMQSTARLHSHYHKFSGVVVDIFYDYFLATQWKNYSSVSLVDFSKHAHSVLLKYRYMMPEKSKHFLSYMLMNDVPIIYSQYEGIERVLYGMSRRTSVKSNIEHATIELKLYHNLFKQEFNLFFTDMMTEANKKRLEF